LRTNVITGCVKIYRRVNVGWKCRQKTRLIEMLPELVFNGKGIAGKIIKGMFWIQRKEIIANI